MWFGDIDIRTDHASYFQRPEFAQQPRLKIMEARRDAELQARQKNVPSAYGALARARIVKAYSKLISMLIFRLMISRAR
jgi:hypothetical protein